MTSPDGLHGSATAIHTPTTDKTRVPVRVTVCDKHVPPAAENVIGQCTYYYRPLHKEYVAKTGVATWDAVKSWASLWEPWHEDDVNRRLFQRRDELIQANSASPDWSRHACFMMRHIGCGHQPPVYYVSYGYYYCSRYGKLLRPRLSNKGQDWLDSARKLLQRNMELGLKNNMAGNGIYIPCKRYPNRSVRMTVPQYQLEITTGLFKTYAFNTHVPSYLDGGLADLPLSDLTKIGAEPNIEEWLDKETWGQATASGDEVGKDKTRQAWHAVKSEASKVGDAVESGAHKARDTTAHAAEATGRAVDQAIHWLMSKL